MKDLSSRNGLVEVCLQVVNLGLVAGSLGLIVRGFFVADGLAGLGIALFLTSLISAIGFHYGIKQERAGISPGSSEHRVKNDSFPLDLAS